MALYRTYRPARLDDVVGQEHVTGPLRRALENDRVHHAYLFSGPRGCGKTSTARILARSMNCEQGPTADPCGVCQSCMDLAPNGPGSIDVIELDAASHGGVEDTRDLRERAMFAPASSRYKVYIIDEAHMVTTQGFNALLKLVEEPPPHVRFIFATTEAEKVLPTIRSRTHNYTFRLVPVRTLQQLLARNCESEGIAAEPAALALIARAGAGSVRDSQSILGQVISGSGPDGVTYREAIAQLGMTDATLLDATINALADHDGAALFTAIDQVIDAGHDPRRFVTDLLERFRDLIVLHNVPNAAEIGLIDGPEDQITREVAQSQRFGPAELTRAADVTSSALTELRGATAPRLHLEIMVARLMLPAADADETGTRARLDQLERRMALSPVVAATVEEPATEVPAAPRRLSEIAPSTADAAAAPARSAPPTRPKPGAQSAPAESPPPAASAESNTASSSLDQFTSMWPAVLESVKSLSRVAWLAFSDSKPASLSNGILAVAVESQGKIKNIKDSGNDERLRQAVLDVMRADVRIDVILDPSTTAPAPAAAGAAPALTPSAEPRATTPSAAPEPDAPSLDDPDGDGTTGIDLALRELGATRIGEIEH